MSSAVKNPKPKKITANHFLDQEFTFCFPREKQPQEEQSLGCDSSAAREVGEGGVGGQLP